MSAISTTEAEPIVGDAVTVCAGFGSELPVEGIVTGIGVEHGRAVVDYREPNGRERWAYLYQITEVRRINEGEEAPGKQTAA